MWFNVAINGSVKHPNDLVHDLSLEIENDCIFPVRPTVSFVLHHKDHESLFRVDTADIVRSPFHMICEARAKTNHPLGVRGVERFEQFGVCDLSAGLLYVLCAHFDVPMRIVGVLLEEYLDAAIIQNLSPSDGGVLLLWTSACSATTGTRAHSVSEERPQIEGCHVEGLKIRNPRDGDVGCHESGLELLHLVGKDIILRFCSKLTVC